MKRRSRLASLCLVFAVLAGGAGSRVVVAGPPDEASATHGFDRANLDPKCKPCEDFYQFANGGWLEKNPIPAAYPSWGRFDELAERNLNVLRTICDEAAANTSAPAGSPDRKIGDFYASGMDTAKIDAAGITPLDPEFKRIAAIADVASLQATIARLQVLGVDAAFGFGSSQDAKESTKVIGEAVQGGLGLPERDYYLKDDERYKEIRKAYVEHVARMFVLLGDNQATATSNAATVMALETRLATASMPIVDQRDPNNVYHKMTVAELKQLTPDFDWPGYFSRIGAPPIDAINVAHVDFFKGLNKELTATPLADWKVYLRWRLIDSTARSLPAKFVDEDFDFKGRVLTGTTENQPLWKRRVRATDRALGEALGQLYVRKTFTPAAKARMLEMVNNLSAALKDDLATLPWMSDATRKQAIGKLDAFVRKIGYPDAWRDYAKLQVDRGPFILNVLRSREFENARDLAKIGKPVDRLEWGMSPPTVNAYYNPLMNEIVFPAGILQPPFFDPNADDAINYGGIGAVIGHEMTHAFDDEGSQFDAQGNLKNWWAEQDLTNFKARAKCVEDQFSGYVAEGKNLNGKLVAGESIADLGGLTIAYAAFQRSLKGKPRPPDVDGFTPEQRFFLGWAQVWAENARAQYTLLGIDTDPHPVSRFRVNGPLSNMPAFTDAFKCAAGQPMVRPDSSRCVIW